MDSRLFMEIGFVNNTFQAIDKTPYERWINDSIFDNDHTHMIIQRLVSIKDGDNNRTVKFSKIATNNLALIRNSFEANDTINGLYYFQKLIIPDWNHVSLANEKIYYNAMHRVIFEDVDNDIIESYDPENDFDEIYDLVRKYYPDNCFYFDDYSFSIYSLVECYVYLEKDRINNFLRNNCNGSCKENLELDYKADILLAAINVINDLMEKGDFFEAQRILNGLNTCGNLCKNYTNTLKGCGCGKS